MLYGVPQHQSQLVASCSTHTASWRQEQRTPSSLSPLYFNVCASPLTTRSTVGPGSDAALPVPGPTWDFFCLPWRDCGSRVGVLGTRGSCPFAQGGTSGFAGAAGARQERARGTRACRPAPSRVAARQQPAPFGKPGSPSSSCHCSRNAAEGQLNPSGRAWGCVCRHQDNLLRSPALLRSRFPRRRQGTGGRAQ